MIKSIIASVIIALGFHCKSQSLLDDILISAGYNYCTKNFLDVGLRFYQLNSDGQALMEFSGFSLGTEINFSKNENTFIPYIGWQGQKMFFAYGIRAEYGINKNAGAFGFTPEIGVSLIEVLRITGGYRFVVENHDPLSLSGLRFSIIAALPLGLLKKDKSQ